MRRQLCVVALAVAGIVLGRTGPVAAQAEGNPGYLGVFFAPPEEGGGGVVVREVTTGSPAEKAGIKVGDRIRKVGDRDIKTLEDLIQAMTPHQAGTKVKLVIDRAGKEQTVSATLAERPTGLTGPGGGRPTRPGRPGSIEERAPAYLGVQVQPLTAELRSELQVGAEGGAVVSEVVPGSPAFKAGLRRDDVITSVDGKEVLDPAALQQAIQNAGSGKEVVLGVSRDGKKVAIKAQPEAGAWGRFVTPAGGSFPSDMGSMFDQGRRIRELERRVAELEKKLNEREKKNESDK